MPNPSLKTAVRACALLDLPLVAWLAVPGAAGWFLIALDRLDVYLGGQGLDPSLPPVGWLFVNLAGVLGVLWALIRLVRPGVVAGALDAGGRLLVAALLIYYVVAADLAAALLIFVLTEAGGAALQAVALARAVRRNQP